VEGREIQLLGLSYLGHRSPMGFFSSPEQNYYKLKLTHGNSCKLISI
jgi:hypothetical protein